MTTIKVAKYSPGSMEIIDNPCCELIEESCNMNMLNILNLTLVKGKEFGNFYGSHIRKMFQIISSALQKSILTTLSLVPLHYVLDNYL